MLMLDQAVSRRPRHTSFCAGDLPSSVDTEPCFLDLNSSGDVGVPSSSTGSLLTGALERVSSGLLPMMGDTAPDMMLVVSSVEATKSVTGYTLIYSKRRLEMDCLFDARARP